MLQEAAAAPLMPMPLIDYTRAVLLDERTTAINVGIDNSISTDLANIVRDASCDTC